LTQTRLQLYISAVRVIELRGCLPLAIQLNGFPHLFDIFPRATKIISSTQELIRHIPTETSLDVTQSQYTLTSTFSAEFSHFFDSVKYAKLPSHGLPASWTIKRCVVLHLATCSTHASYIYAFGDTIPSLLSLDHIKHLHVHCNTGVTANSLVKILEARILLSSLQPINSLQVITDENPLKILERLARCQSAGGQHLQRLKLLSSISPAPYSTLPALLRIDWNCLRALSHLEMDFSSEQVAKSPAFSRRLADTSIAQGMFNTYYDATPSFRSTFVCVPSILKNGPLNLSSFVLHLHVDPNAYDPKSDDNTVSNLTRALPTFSELAVFLLSIGGNCCEYDIRLGMNYKPELQYATKVYVASVKKEISRLIIRNNTLPEKGWKQLEMTKNSQEPSKSDRMVRKA
jgi:hypothetical protein